MITNAAGQLLYLSETCKINVYALVAYFFGNIDRRETKSVFYDNTKLFLFYLKINDYSIK